MTSFSSLLEVHRDLDEVFFEHQRALMRGELDDSFAKLNMYETALLAHMQDEEQLLLPIYVSRAEMPLGGTDEIFLNEHIKIKHYLELIKAEFPKLLRAKDPERAILFLLDSETTFKKLLVHHDTRERKILFPLLDQVVTDDEKRSLFLKLGLSPEESSRRLRVNVK